MTLLKKLFLPLFLLLPNLALAQGPSSAQVEAAKGQVKLFPTASLPSSCPPGMRVYDITVDGSVVCKNDGVTWASIGGAGGSGTAGKLAKWTASTTLGNSLLSDDGTNVTLSSGQLLLPAGTAALPSMSFSGDPNTGIYSDDADKLLVATAGTKRYLFDAAAFYPNATGTYSSGLSTRRWSSGYFGGQTLTTTVTPLWDGSVTWNDSGTSHQGILLSVTDTASASASTLIDLKVGGASKFSVGKAGQVVAASNITAGGAVIGGTGAGLYARNGASTAVVLFGSSDGVGMLTNYAATDFGRLQLGGTTSSFPAIKRSGAAITTRLADDSADTYLLQSGIYGSLYETGGSTAITITTAGTYYQWVNSTAGACTNMTCATATDDITATIAGKYRVTAVSSFVSGTNNEIITGRIFNEGSGQTQCTGAKKLATAANMNDISISCIVTMAVNDSLTLMFTSTSSSTSVTPSEVNISASYLGN